MHYVYGRHWIIFWVSYASVSCTIQHVLHCSVLCFRRIIIFVLSYLGVYVCLHCLTEIWYHNIKRGLHWSRLLCHYPLSLQLHWSLSLSLTPLHCLVIVSLQRTSTIRFTPNTRTLGGILLSQKIDHLAIIY